jgi:hypothetical protein
MESGNPAHLAARQGGRISCVCRQLTTNRSRMGESRRPNGHRECERYLHNNRSKYRIEDIPRVRTIYRCLDNSNNSDIPLNCGQGNGFLPLEQRWTIVGHSFGQFDLSACRRRFVDLDLARWRRHSVRRRRIHVLRSIISSDIVSKCLAYWQVRNALQGTSIRRVPPTLSARGKSEISGETAVYRWLQSALNRGALHATCMRRSFLCAWRGG